MRRKTVLVFGRAVAVVLGAAWMMWANAAPAQSVLGDPTNPAKTFASNCSICHKTPKGLAKTSSSSELAGFLRQHYTTGKDTGSAMAAYLLGAGPGPASDSRAKQGGDGERPPAAVGRVHDNAKPDGAKPSAKDARGARAKGRKQEPAAEHGAAEPGDEQPAASGGEPAADIATEEPAPRKPRQKAAARTKDGQDTTKRGAKQRPPATAARPAEPAAQAAKDGAAAKPAGGAKPVSGDKPAGGDKPAAGEGTAAATPAVTAAAAEGATAGGEKPSFSAPLP